MLEVLQDMASSLSSPISSPTSSAKSGSMSNRSSSPTSSWTSSHSRTSSWSEDLESPTRVKPTATEKLIDLKASAEEKLIKASARLTEKAVLVRTNLALGVYRIIHHEHSPRHDKCLNYVAETQTAATERRLRREQEARERAEWERAVAREWSLYKSSKHVEQQHRSSSSPSRTHLEQESRAHQNLLQGAA